MGAVHREYIRKILYIPHNNSVIASSGDNRSSLIISNVNKLKKPYVFRLYKVNDLFFSCLSREKCSHRCLSGLRMFRFQSRAEYSHHRRRRLSRSDLEPVRHAEEHGHSRRTSRSGDRCEDSRTSHSLLHVQQRCGKKRDIRTRSLLRENGVSRWSKRGIWKNSSVSKQSPCAFRVRLEGKRRVSVRSPRISIWTLRLFIWKPVYPVV